MPKKMSKEEKDAYDMMKKLIDEPKKLKSSDWKAGSIIMYQYSPKYDKNPYDKTPVNMVLSRSKGYTLCWAINWTPPKLREKVIDYVMKKNKKNIEKGLHLRIDYKTIKKIIIGLGPVIRLYINRRISPKGVIIPPYQYYKVVNLRAENFIGISAEKAWKIAKRNKKKQKKKRSK